MEKKISDSTPLFNVRGDSYPEIERLNIVGEETFSKEKAADLMSSLEESSDYTFLSPNREYAFSQYDQEDVRKEEEVVEYEWEMKIWQVRDEKIFKILREELDGKGFVFVEDRYIAVGKYTIIKYTIIEEKRGDVLKVAKKCNFLEIYCPEKIEAVAKKIGLICSDRMVERTIGGVDVIERHIPIVGNCSVKQLWTRIISMPYRRCRLAFELLEKMVPILRQMKENGFVHNDINMGNLIVKVDEWNLISEKALIEELYIIDMDLSYLKCDGPLKKGCRFRRYCPPDEFIFDIYDLWCTICVCVDICNDSDCYSIVYPDQSGFSYESYIRPSLKKFFDVSFKKIKSGGLSVENIDTSPEFKEMSDYFNQVTSYT